MKDTFLNKFITLQEQFRILHWQTKSYARHNAFGGIYSDLDEILYTNLLVKIDDLNQIIKRFKS